MVQKRRTRVSAIGRIELKLAETFAVTIWPNSGSAGSGVWLKSPNNGEKEDVQVFRICS